jgi:hypothetical protein
MEVDRRRFLQPSTVGKTPTALHATLTSRCDGMHSRKLWCALGLGLSLGSQQWAARMDGERIHPNNLVQHLHCKELELRVVFCNWFEAQRYQPAVLPCPLHSPRLSWADRCVCPNLLPSRCRGFWPHTLVTVHCVHCVPAC